MWFWEKFNPTQAFKIFTHVILGEIQSNTSFQDIYPCDFLSLAPAPTIPTLPSLSFKQKRINSIAESNSFIKMMYEETNIQAQFDEVKITKHDNDKRRKMY